MAMELVRNLPYNHPYRWDGTEVGGKKLWRPTEIATALWLDAEDTSTVTLNGSTVSQWNDKSGNGRHATQATAAQQPAYETANAVLNGKSALVWPTAGNALAIVTPSFAHGNVFIVAAYSTGAQATWLSGYTGLFGSNTTSDVGLVGDVSGANWYNTSAFPFVRYDGGAELNVTAGVVALPMPARIVHSRAASNLTIPEAIGRDRNFSGRGWVGPIGEVIATDAVLSDTNRTKIEGYLAWKWGLEANLPANHPFKNLPPTV